MTFTVATFNCNSVRSRLPIVLDWLKRHSPDVLALQETKVVDELFPKAEFEQAGYRVVFRGEKYYNGVALACREEPSSVAFGLDDGKEPADEARLVRAEVRKIVIVNTYVPQGFDVDSPKWRYKLRWIERLQAYFARHFTPRKKVIWVGDLNIAPAPIDVYDSKKFMGKHVCHHPEMTKAYEAFVVWGFVDVFRKHRPNPGEYAFYDYRLPNALERNLGWRVDHVLATRPVANRSVDARIDLEPRRLEKPSDHTVMAAEFDL